MKNLTPTYFAFGEFENEESYLNLYKDFVVVNIDLVRQFGKYSFIIYLNYIDTVLPKFEKYFYDEFGDEFKLVFDKPLMTIYKNI